MHSKLPQCNTLGVKDGSETSPFQNQVTKALNQQGRIIQIYNILKGNDM